MAFEKTYNPQVIILDKLKAKVYERWLTNPLKLVGDCFFTNDERYAGAGFSPIRPYPVGEVAIQYIWWKSFLEKTLHVDKFRQGTATWLLAVARNLVTVLLHEGTKCYILKRKFKEADDILQQRVMFVYNNIPEKKRILIDGVEEIIYPKEMLPRCIYREGEVRVERRSASGKILPASYIFSLEAGIDQARGVTGSNGVIDEAAYTSDLIRVYMSMRPAMEHIQLISSPKRGQFVDMRYGLESAIGLKSI